MREITVIRAGALGDVVLSLPALSTLRMAYPGARIRVVGYPEHWAIAGALADEVVSIDAPEFAPLFTDVPMARPSRYLAGSDLVVAWTRQDPTPVLQRWGVRRVLHASPYPPPGLHAASWLLRTLDPVLLDGSHVRSPLDLSSWLLHLDAHELAAGRAALQRLGLQRPVVLHPGAGAEWKRWPADRYAALEDELRRRGFDVALVEGPADAAVVGEVLRSTGSMTVLPQTGARALAALLSGASLYVGNDSGVTHVAASAGTPTIALFGPTDPTLWHPLGTSLVLRHCGATSTAQTAIRVCDDPACMAAITVEDVLRAAGRLHVQSTVE